MTIKPGTDIYYSTLFLAPDKREATQIIWSLAETFREIWYQIREPEVARAKINWWQSEINNTFEHQPTHPLTQALSPLIDRYALTQQSFANWLDYHLVAYQPMLLQTETDLMHHCHQIAGIREMILCQIQGKLQAEILRYSQSLAVCLELINILACFHNDLQHQRLFLPQHDCQQLGIDANLIFNQRWQDIEEKQLTQLFSLQAARARKHYQEALAQLPQDVRIQHRARIIYAELKLQYLREIELDKFRIWQHQVAVTPLRKLYYAWQTNRRELRLQKKLACLMPDHA